MRIQSHMKRFFQLIFPIFLLGILANCAGGEKRMEDLLANDGIEEEEGEDLLNDDNLMADEFGEDNSDDLAGDLDFDEEENTDDLDLTSNFDEENPAEFDEDNDDTMSFESDSDNIEVSDLDLTVDDGVDENIAPVELEEFQESESRVVRYVKEDCDVYDSSRTNVIGSFKKGEPVVVTLGSDGWASLDASHFVKAEHLSVKGIARKKTKNPFK